MALEKEFIPIVATLCFLKKETNMTLMEADMILVTFNDIKQGKEIEKNLTVPNHLKPRAFRFVFTFLGVLISVIKLFKAFGFLDCIATYIPFDGVYFHNLFNEWDDLEHFEKLKVLSEISDLRLYSELFD